MSSRIKGFQLALMMLMLGLVACSREKPAAASAATQAEVAPESHASAALPETGPTANFDGAAALQFTKQVVAFGPRPVGSAAHEKLENFLVSQLKGFDIEDDRFTAETPAGMKPMRNLIAKFPGTKDGIIVLCGHYDTLYNRPDFVGANDGGSSTGLLLQVAKQLGAEARNGKLAGYSVWVVFLDGEEALKQWSPTDSLYGSRHLAQRWENDGTLKRVKALLLVDMIGDADLEILRDTNSTPWLEDLVYQAATRYGYQSHFFNMQTAMEDDHMPFVHRGVPSADLIDFNYGYNNAFWHTKEDTLDKLSANSLQIVGSVVLETIKMVNHR